MYTGTTRGNPLNATDTSSTPNTHLTAPCPPLQQTITATHSPHYHRGSALNIEVNRGLVVVEKSNLGKYLNNC